MATAALVICVLCALLAPIIRAQSPRVRDELIISLYVNIAVALLVVVILCCCRMRLERTAGDQLIENASFNRVGGGFSNGLVLLMCLIGIGFGANSLLPLMAKQAFSDATWPEMRWFFRVGIFAVTVVPVAAMTFVSVLLWWRLTVKSMEIRRNGMIYSAIFLYPWNVVKSFTWTKAKYCYVLKMKIGYTELSALVPFENKDDVDVILSEFVERD
ncbi:MAG: hypothetical protein ACI9HK_001703 [Pirellulaceae bacterium]|jgi:hypothetical protein